MKYYVILQDETLETMIREYNNISIDKVIDREKIANKYGIFKIINIQKHYIIENLILKNYDVDCYIYNQETDIYHYDYNGKYKIINCISLNKLH